MTTLSAGPNSCGKVVKSYKRQSDLNTLHQIWQLCLLVPTVAKKLSNLISASLTLILFIRFDNFVCWSQNTVDNSNICNFIWNWIIPDHVNIDFRKTIRKIWINRSIEMSFSGRVMLLVTKKFAKTFCFYSNIRSKLFGTPTAAENFIIKLL